MKKSFQKYENLRFKHIVTRKSCWTVQIDCLKFETAKYVCELKQILYYLYYNSPTHVIIFLSGLDLHLLMNWRCFFQLQIYTILSQYDLCTRDNGLPKFGLFYNGPYFTKISFLGFFTCAIYIYIVFFFKAGSSLPAIAFTLLIQGNNGPKFVFQQGSYKSKRPIIFPV